MQEGLMTGSFEQWLVADEQWLEKNFTLLERVFQWFLDNGEWPKVGPLQQALYQDGDRTTKVQEIANARPTIPVHPTPIDKPSIPLAARHLLKVSAAKTLLMATVASTQKAVTAYLAGTPGEQVSVKNSDIDLATSGQRNTLQLVPNFVFSDHPTPFAGGGINGEEWSLSISENFIMKFEGIVTPEDYVEQQLEIIRGWCDEHDTRLIDTQKIGPYKAFVVMPFEEVWSNLSHTFIKAAIRKADTGIVTVRADEIPDPGRITNQIVAELQECDIIIADITGNNPNVAWELGYAYAYGKQCVIIRQKGASGSAPFDIYDHRRTDYSAIPTEVEETQLAESIRRAFEIVRASKQPIGDWKYLQ